MYLEKQDNIIFLVEEKKSLPDFPPIKIVVPVMTKEIFRICYHEWILKEETENEHLPG